MGSRDWLPEHLRFAVDAASVALWCRNVDTDERGLDEYGFHPWGLPWADVVSFDELSARIDPADRDQVRAAFQATRSVTGLYVTDFRVMLGDEIRRASVWRKGPHESLKDRSSFGIFIDVTQCKQVEEANELLASEMSHRGLNLLAIGTALMTMTG